MKLKRLQLQVSAFNAKYKVGDEVMLHKDSGENVKTKIRHASEILGGHSAVVWLEGVSGCYLINRIYDLTKHKIKE